MDDGAHNSEVKSAPSPAPVPAKRRWFQFSLATLILAVIGVGALGGGACFLAVERKAWANAERTHAGMLSDLNQIEKTMYMCSDYNAGKLPACLDDLETPVRLLNGQYQFYINYRCAELDVGFYTVSGLTQSDAGAVWLYENLPDEASALGRFVLRVGSGPELLSESEFQEALAKTLAIQGTRTVANSRTASQFANTDAAYYEDHMVCRNWDHLATFRYGIWRDELRLKHWPFVWAQSTPFLIIAFVAFSVMGYRRWRENKAARPGQLAQSSTG